jgi:tagatose 6-phosphate kinase
VVDERNGTGTSFYGTGPAVDDSHFTELEELVRFWLQAGRVLVLAGSLPPGAPTGIYATFIRMARAHGVLTVLDAATSQRPSICLGGNSRT